MEDHEGERLGNQVGQKLRHGSTRLEHVGGAHSVIVIGLSLTETDGVEATSVLTPCEAGSPGCGHCSVAGVGWIGRETWDWRGDRLIERKGIGRVVEPNLHLYEVHARPDEHTIIGSPPVYEHLS